MINLLELANELDKAKRMGTEKDIPEGGRYIKISDTLAQQIAKDLREYDDCIDNGMIKGINY